MKRGFSLIEVVIALVILSIGCGAALSLVVTASNRLQRAWLLELALARSAEVADSLGDLGGMASSGGTTEPWGSLRWGGGGGGTVLRAWLGADSSGVPDVELRAGEGAP